MIGFPRFFKWGCFLFRSKCHTCTPPLRSVENTILHQHATRFTPLRPLLSRAPCQELSSWCAGQAGWVLASGCTSGGENVDSGWEDWALSSGPRINWEWSVLYHVGDRRHTQNIKSIKLLVKQKACLLFYRRAIWTFWPTQYYANGRVFKKLW